MCFRDVSQINNISSICSQDSDFNNCNKSLTTMLSKHKNRYHKPFKIFYRFYLRRLEIISKCNLKAFLQNYLSEPERYNDSLYSKKDCSGIRLALLTSNTYNSNYCSSHTKLDNVSLIYFMLFANQRLSSKLQLSKTENSISIEYEMMRVHCMFPNTSKRSSFVTQRNVIFSYFLFIRK